MPTTLRHLGAYVLIALIALASPTYVFAHPYEVDTRKADNASSSINEKASQSDDQQADGEDRSVDLGYQPVLLLHQSFKPIAQAAPDPIEIHVDVLAEVYAKFPHSSVAESQPVDEQVVTRPSPHTGISQMPHGPPVTTS